MNKYKTLLKNTLLVFGGGIGSKLIVLFMMPLYTKWLSVEGYGETDLITIYATLLVSIVSCCIPDALFVFPCGEQQSKQREYFSSGLFFNFFTIVLTTIIFMLIDFIKGFYCWNNSFVNYLWLIYIMLVSTIFQQQVQQFSRSTNHMVVYSLTGLVYTIIVFSLSFVLVRNYGVVGYFICIMIANIISALYCICFAHLYRYINLRWCKLSVIKEMLAYSIPLIPNSVIWWLVSALNRPIMEVYVGIQDVGIYAVANRFPGILTMLFTMFTVSWQISAIEEFKKDSFAMFFNRIFKFIFCGLVCILLCISLNSKFLIEYFADSQFYTAWKYIPILTFGTFISCISAFIGVNFNASRESKYLLYSSLYGAITSIILNFILIPKWGIWGASFSVVASFLTIAVVRYIYSNKYVKISGKGFYIALLLGAILTLTLYGFGYLVLSIITSLLILMYIIIGNSKEIPILRKKLNLLFNK